MGEAVRVDLLITSSDQSQSQSFFFVLPGPAFKPTPNDITSYTTAELLEELGSRVDKDDEYSLD